MGMLYLALLFNKSLCNMTLLFKRLFPLLLLFTLLACGGNDQKTRPFAEAGQFFLDYQVNAAEGDDKLTVLLRFRNGEEGDAFTLPDGAAVFLDNQGLVADSSKRTGSYYETHLPIDSFEGWHTIQLKQNDRLVSEMRFEFHPLTLENEPGDTLSRQDLVLTFTGPQKMGVIRVIATDTAFSSSGINRVDTMDGKLTISRADMENLVNGPVQLLLSREWETPFEKDRKPMGKITIAYSLRREFILKD
jgi:hypothetical protein